jgi:hypothetical protein
MKPASLRSPCFAALALLLLSAPALDGCSAARKEWRQTKRLDTSEGYRAYATRNPTSPWRSEALTRTEALDWKNAITRDSPDAWGTYVAFHPGSARIGEARSRLEEARWKAANDEQSRQAFEMYLSAHPSGPHAEEARAKLDEIAWSEADREGTIDAYSRYLVRYPGSAHAQEAKDKREALYWQDATTRDGPLEYQVYLKKFPTGVHAAEAKAAIDGFRFSGLAVRLVVERTVRGDSLATLKAQVLPPLQAHFSELGFEVAWLDVVDARGRAVDPFENLLLEVPEDHAALVVVLSEEPGRAFAPSGTATDIEAELFVVPPARVQPFLTDTVDASTSPRVVVESEHGLHLDAQRQLGVAITQAKLPLAEWKK